MARDDDRVPVSGTLVLNLVARTSDGDRRLTGDVNLSGELTVQCPVSRGSASASAAGSLDLKPITVMLVEVSALPAAPARCVHHGAAAEAPRRGDDGDETGQARNLLLVEGAAEEAAGQRCYDATSSPPEDPASRAVKIDWNACDFDSARGVDLILAAGAGADGVAEGAAATQRQTPSNSPVHGEPDAEAIGPAGGLVDTPPAPSVRGPVFEVPDSPPPATSASAEAPSAAEAPLAGTNTKKRSWAFNEEFVASSAPRPVWQDSSLGHQLTDMDQLLGQLSQARGSEYA